MHIFGFFQHGHLNGDEAIGTLWTFSNFSGINIQIVLKLIAQHIFKFIQHEHSNRAEVVSTFCTFSNFPNTNSNDAEAISTFSNFSTMNI